MSCHAERVNVPMSTTITKHYVLYKSRTHRGVKACNYKVNQIELCIRNTQMSTEVFVWLNDIQPSVINIHHSTRNVCIHENGTPVICAVPRLFITCIDFFSLSSIQENNNDICSLCIGGNIFRLQLNNIVIVALTKQPNVYSVLNNRYRRLYICSRTANAPKIKYCYSLLLLTWKIDEPFCRAVTSRSR